MIDFLEAPFPYVIGLSRDTWRFIQENKWEHLPEEIIAFDIDHNKVFMKEELPRYPEPYTSFLIEGSKKVTEKIRDVRQFRGLNWRGPILARIHLKSKEFVP